MTEDVKGFIVMPRDIIMKWSGSPNTLALFNHCVSRANFQDTYFKGRLIKRGSFIATLEQLSKTSGLTEAQVRYSLKQLEEAKDIRKTKKRLPIVFTIKNYDSYQASSKLVTNSKHIDNFNLTTDNKLNNLNKLNTLISEDDLNYSRNQISSLYPHKNKIGRENKEDKKIFERLSQKIGAARTDNYINWTIEDTKYLEALVSKYSHYLQNDVSLPNFEVRTIQ